MGLFVMQQSNALLMSLLGALLACLWCCSSRILRRRMHKLPPGPPGHFILGHFNTVPFEAPFKAYAAWGEEYHSDILYFETLSKKWIVLNSREAALELLERRGWNYSDRPRFVLFEEMRWAPTLTWLRWGPKMHLHRRALQPAFSKSQVQQYQDVQRHQALICATSLLKDPANWIKIVRRFAVAIVLDIGYGIEVDGPDSPWIKIAEDAGLAVGNSGTPAGSLIDHAPATRYLPDWLPFMKPLRFARRCRPAIKVISNEPFLASSKELHEERRKKCFVHDRLEIYQFNSDNAIPNDFTLEDIRGAAATIHIAGNNTTATTIMLLVLYLMQNPSVQQKAQAELDRVVGSNRLPTWADLPNLPYLYLVLQETYRMNPLSPLCIPHASLAADTYRGYYIPAGTVVYANVWAMHHDPATYHDPFVFRPERFLPPDEGGGGEPLPMGNFGFGRRACVGRHLAENSLLIVLALLLATTDIRFPLSEDGERRAFEPAWSYKGQAYPLPFPASFECRAPITHELLRAALAKA